MLEGKTDPECTILLSDAKIKIEKDGNFAFRAVLESEKKSNNLTAIDKNGNKNSALIYLEPQKRLVIRPAGGASMLAGGGLNASKIGYIFGDILVITSEARLYLDHLHTLLILDAKRLNMNLRGRIIKPLFMLEAYE